MKTKSCKACGNKSFEISCDDDCVELLCVACGTVQTVKGRYISGVIVAEDLIGGGE